MLAPYSFAYGAQVTPPWKAPPFSVPEGAAFALGPWDVYGIFAWGYETVRPGRIMGQGTAKVYRIVVRSELGERYASAFEGMSMEGRGGRTILTGEVRDQPQLFGILDRLYGLGLELLSVRIIS